MVTHVFPTNRLDGEDKVFVVRIKNIMINERKIEMKTDNKKNPNTVETSIEPDKRIADAFEVILIRPL